jgi:hypothetical protein
VAGSIPWIAIAIYLIGPSADQHPRKFVDAIFFSLFVLFNCFAVNQWLQCKQVGKWSDYLIGERAYITLSLVARSSQEPIRAHIRGVKPGAARYVPEMGDAASAETTVRSGYSGTGAVFPQERDEARVVALLGLHEWGELALLTRVRVGAGGEQQPARLEVEDGCRGRAVERLDPHLVAGDRVHLRAGCQQLAHDTRAPEKGRQMERGEPVVRPRSSERGIRPEQRADRGRVAEARRLEHVDVALGRQTIGLDPISPVQRRADPRRRPRRHRPPSLSRG